MFDVCEEGVIYFEPELEIGDDAPDHGHFPFVGVGQINLYVVFPGVWVNPGEDVPLRVGKNHVLVDNEEPVVRSE